MSTLNTLIDKYWEKVLLYRRWLHAHPELSGQEEKTAAFIAGALRDMGLAPTEHVGGFGVTALIEGKGAGKCVGLRADFDALPVEECTGLPFASENSGVMHACGHDVHTAMLLGAAHVLNDMRDRFCGTVKLVFQPSEESSGKTGKSGAVRMIEDGVLQNPPVDAMFGQHLDAALETGSIIFKSGPMTAASDRFYIDIYGKGSHASKPDQGVDAIAVGAQVVNALHSIVSRNVSPLDCAVVTVGTISGGTASNVLAEHIEMSGTCRTHNEETRNLLERRMEAVVKGITEGMGADYTFRYRRGHPTVFNDPEIYELARTAAEDAIGKEHVIQLDRPSLGAEDFAHYAQQVPGTFYRLGCLKKGAEAWPLHSGHFNPDEECMKIGICVLTSAALRFLQRDESDLHSLDINLDREARQVSPTFSCLEL